MVEKINAVDASGTSESDSTARFRVENILTRRGLSLRICSKATLVVQRLSGIDADSKGHCPLDVAREKKFEARTLIFLGL